MRGRDKLLEKIEGTPLLLRQVRVALSVGLPVLVTLPPNHGARAAALNDTACGALETQPISDAACGISASLRAGAHWATARQLSGLMVLLPDMPDVTTQDVEKIAALHAAHPRDVIRATNSEGQYGHPTLLPARLLPMLATLTGDTGAREVLKQETIRACPLAGNRATTDLDTPEAWDAWRAARD